MWLYAWITKAGVGLALRDPLGGWWADSSPGGQQNKSVAPASKLNSSHEDYRMGSRFAVVRVRLGWETEGIHLSEIFPRHATSTQPGLVEA